MITKSLFLEFRNAPKLAWWHINDRDVYETIKELLNTGPQRADAGMQVEQMAIQRFAPIKPYQIPVPDRSDDDWYQRYADITSKTIAENRGVLYYQAAFHFNDLFCICDLLIPNKDGTFDMVEVKSSHSVRSKKKKTLNPKIAFDIAFQTYLLKRTFGKMFSGRSWLCYLNSDFVKSGPVNPAKVLACEEVSKELPSEKQIESQLEIMRKELALDEKEFNKKHPFNGSRYITFFGKQPEPGSIWRIPGQTHQFNTLLQEGKDTINELTPDDLALLQERNKLNVNQARYVRLYQKHKTFVDKNLLRKRILQLKQPLVFYDYETISTPIPILNGTRPWEQIVVQFAMYILDRIPGSGNIRNIENLCHKYEGLIEPGASDNRLIVSQLIDAIKGVDGTFIVWNKQFENACNRKMAKLCPEYAGELEKMNTYCFDLMDVFRDLIYFDRHFNGSNSLKDILPVITDLDYNDLEIQNGSEATTLLESMIKGEIAHGDLNQVRVALLAYCERDTLAMVKIFEKLLLAAM